MKKVILAALVLTILTAFTACENQKVSNTDAPAETDDIQAAEQPGTPPVSSEAPNEVIAADDPEIAPPVTSAPDELVGEANYMGTWKIIRDLDSGTVSTLSQDDIDALIGKMITYSLKSAASDTDKCDYPFYKESSYTEDEFIAYTKTRFETLGIAEDTVAVTGVMVYTDEAYETPWYGLGSSFFIISENTMILSHEGTYFELLRAE